MAIEFPNIRHLRAFKEVAEQRGISAAAERVHLSQPAVTQAIAKLEGSLGVALFERRAEGMFTTEVGGLFLLRIQRLFEHLEQGAEQASRISGRRENKPTFGFHNNVTAAQLRALVAIWDNGSFSLAARAIGISQPSTHRAGRDLEKLSGMTLFVGTRKGIELTPQAEVFARSVRLAAAELRQGYMEVAHINGRDTTHIVVGSMPLSRTSILPKAIHGLLQDGHEIQVRTVDGPYSELLKGLRHGDLDVLVGAIRNPAPTDDIVQETLMNDALAIVVSPNHPLAKRQNVTLADTLQYPWIAPPKATPAGRFLYDVLKISELEHTPVRIVSSSLVLLRGLLQIGDYVTVISLNQAATECAQGLMVPLKISLSDNERPIGITYRSGWKPTRTQERFLELIRRAIRT